MTTSEQLSPALESAAAIRHQDAEVKGPSAPTLGKILLTDYWSFVLLLLSLAALITVVASPALFLLVPLLVRRVRRIRRTFATGTATAGVVLRKYFLRGEWAVVYGFQVGDATVQVRNYVLGFRLPVKKRDLVTVIYDPDKPSRAFLPILYAPPSRPSPSASIAAVPAPSRASRSLDRAPAAGRR